MYRAPVEWDNRPMDSFTEPPHFDEEHVNFTIRYYFNRNHLLTSKVIWGVADESAWKKEPCRHDCKFPACVWLKKTEYQGTRNNLLWHDFDHPYATPAIGSAIWVDFRGCLNIIPCRYKGTYRDDYAKRVTVDEFDFEFFEGLKNQINQDHRLLQGFTKKYWKEVRKRLSNTKGTMDQFVVRLSSDSDDAVAKAAAAIESNADANLEESLKDLKRPAKKMKHEDTTDKENELQRKTFENNPDYIDFKEQKVSVSVPPERKNVFDDLTGDPNAVYAEMNGCPTCLRGICVWQVYKLHVCTHANESVSSSEAAEWVNGVDTYPRRLRYSSYRFLASILSMGRHGRIELPKCAVAGIRNMFPEPKGVYSSEV
jgi:hypothetical protein